MISEARVHELRAVAKTQVEELAKVLLKQKNHDVELAYIGCQYMLHTLNLILGEETEDFQKLINECTEQYYTFKANPESSRSPVPR